MGLVGLPLICEKLIEHGMAASTEVAVVQQGTTRHQRVVTGTLETISGLVEGAGLQAPTLTIIGSVVSLHDELKWFKGDQAENS
jgi:uroporphyrin-III C-methyltransferase/precorrin-2 dehydrogenase/sirohydrochlorin ferrochelatase